jgi:hypothetical protein
MKQKEFLKDIYSMFTISCQTYIQVNEGIVKLFTLMVEGHLNKIMEFKCNTYTILGYLHSTWNLEGYCNPTET